MSEQMSCTSAQDNELARAMGAFPPFIQNIIAKGGLLASLKEE